MEASERAHRTFWRLFVRNGDPYVPLTEEQKARELHDHAEIAKIKYTNRSDYVTKVMEYLFAPKEDPPCEPKI